MKNKQSNRVSWKSSQEGSEKNYLLILIIGICLAAVFFILQSKGILDIRHDSSKALTLQISEVQTNNVSTITDEFGNYCDWVEIENTGSDAVDLNGVFLMPNAKVSRIFSFPKMTLAPGARVLVYCDGMNSEKSPMHADFKLSAAGGMTLGLYDKANNLLDSVELPELGKDESYSRDESGAWMQSHKATPGEVNKITTAAESDPETIAASVTPVNGYIEISEVMTDNNAYCKAPDGNFYDYIELHNSTNATVDLDGLYLSDNAAALKKWQLPAIKLGPDEYMIVYCSGLDSTDGLNGYHASFSLSDTDKIVCLVTSKGEVISAVKLIPMACGEALSLVDGEMTNELAPTPGMANTEGNVSLTNKQLSRSTEIPIQINEVMASPINENCDWVELYNNSSSDIDLHEYFLSDNLGRPRKWRFPEGSVIGPGEYKVIALNGVTGAEQPGMINVPFALSAAGGCTVCLAKEDGTIIDLLRLGPQHQGISYGRTPSGDIGYFETATIMAPNGDHVLAGKMEKAVYSTNGGLYKSGDSIMVSLSCTNGGRIFYTTDCTDPTESSNLYDGTPISITDTTILRTRVFRDGYYPSLMDTQSYLFDIHNAEDVDYVVSLVSDPDGLFSEERGIMVKGPNAKPNFPYGDKGKGANFWMDWERESHLELFTTSGTAISQECGLKIRGRNTRGYELKGMKTIARSTYGNPLFEYPVFSQRSYSDYDKIFLRYTGQDYKMAFMRDPVIMRLARDTSVMYMETELAVVYINGKYYSAMNLRQPIDTYEICRYNGWPETDREALDVVKSGINVRQGSNEDFEAILEWVSSNDTSTEEAYQYIDAHIDIDNYIDYICLICYAATPDTVNVKRYRNPNKDGKWRWALYDVDRGLRENIDPFALLAQGTTARLFKACMSNAKIRERMFARLNELLTTTFASENVVPKIEAMAIKLEPVMPDYLKMFDKDMDHWRGSVRALKRKAQARPMQIIKHAYSYFSLSEEQTNEYFRSAIEKDREYAAKNN